MSPFVVRSPPLCCPRSGCHIALQGTAEPDGEETWCLLKVWDDLAPLLGGDMRMHTAVVAMYILLGDMYGTMFEEGALQAPEVAQAFQRWVCPAIRSPYIFLYLRLVLGNPWGLGNLFYPLNTHGEIEDFLFFA